MLIVEEVVKKTLEKIDDAVAGSPAQCDHRRFGPLQPFDAMQSQELTPNVITYNWPIEKRRDDAVAGARAM